MLKNDFLLKQIQEYIQFLLNLLFPKGNIAVEKARILQSDAFQQLKTLVDDRKINDAEDLLFELRDEGKVDLATGIFFYETLLNIPEKDLRAINFSTKEIETGLKDYAKTFHIEF